MTVRVRRRTPNTDRPLWPYQQPALQYCMRTDCPALFMEMRLGKTLVSIRWMRAAGFRRVLIVCPLSVVRTWQKEFAAEGLSAWSLHGSPAMVRDALTSDDAPPYFVANYESVVGRPAIQCEPWDCVVLDESTLIKNPKAKRTKAVRSAFRHTPHRCLLTGMPNPTEPVMDYYEQLSWLCGGEFMGCTSWWQFQRTYMHAAGPFAWVPNDGTNQKLDAWLRENAFTLTRKNAGVGPGKVREVREVALPGKLRAAYRTAYTDWVLGTEETKWAPVLHSWIRQLVAGCVDDHPSNHKLNEVRSLLSGELSGCPVVLWSAFRAEMDMLDSALTSDGYNVAQINGDLNAGQRERVLERFTAGELDHVICQQDCARFGLNMSRSDTAINVSRSLSPESNWQSEDRIVHAQKTTDVLILDIVVVDTIEEDIRATLLDRRSTSRNFMSRLKARISRRELC